jgi:hypothetical protein
MEGAQFRRSLMAGFTLAVTCAVGTVMLVASVAAAHPPAQDQYSQWLPGPGNGGGSNANAGGGGSGSSAGSTSGGVITPSSSTVVIPVAGSGQNSDQAGGTSAGKGSGPNATGTKGSGTGSGAQSGNSGSVNGIAGSAAGASSDSVFHIAADTAGNGWVPFFIAALLALAFAAAFLFYRNGRGGRADRSGALRS